jgi:hypothetical protein
MVLRDGYEWDLIQTDSRMGVRAYNTVDDPEAQMKAEVRDHALTDLGGAA